MKHQNFTAKGGNLPTGLFVFGEMVEPLEKLRIPRLERQLCDAVLQAPRLLELLTGSFQDDDSSQLNYLRKGRLAQGHSSSGLKSRRQSGHWGDTSPRPRGNIHNWLERGRRKK